MKNNIEIDLTKLTNEKADLIAKILDQENGPIMSLSQARKEFPTIPLDRNIIPVMEEEGKKRKRKLSLTDWLELQDPSENYKPLFVNGKLRFLDAFERQLMVRDLVVSGPNAVELSAFFSNFSNTALFPEFINRNIRAGRLMSSLDVMAEDLIATTTEIDAITYTGIFADFGSDDLQQKMIGEGAPFPEILLTLSDRDIRLQKIGGKIKATYEFLRRVRANQFAVTLQFIGMQWEQDQANYALEVIINGNTGNSNPAVNTNTAITGTMTYEDMVRWMLAGRKYATNLLVASETRAGDILVMDEFIDPMVGSFQTTGNLMTPFGRTLKISDSTDLGDDLIVGVAQPFALEKVTERGSVIQEQQKIMDGQFQEILFSQYIGFAKIIDDASQSLTINW